MSDVTLPDWLWLLGRARGLSIVVRLLVPLSALAAIGCTRAAAGEVVLALSACIVAFALVSTADADSPGGALVVALVVVQWVVLVDDVTTPWSLGAATSLGVFHVATAASSVAPAGARWSKPMARRWSRRTAVVVLASAGTWLLVAAVAGADLAGNGVVVAAALLAAAGVAWWSRSGRLR